MDLKYGKIIKEAISSSENLKTTESSTINKLVDEFIKKFVEELVDHSPRILNTILFPTYFDIIMHPDDYENVKNYFKGFIIPLVNNFYDIITEKKNEFNNGRETNIINMLRDIFIDNGKDKKSAAYVPPMSEWRFCFDSCDKFTENPDMPAKNIEKGGFYFICFPCIGQGQGQTSNKKYRGTILEGDKYTTVDINISDFKSLGKNTFTLPFHNDLRHHTNSSEVSSVIFEPSFHAVLKSMKGKPFEMRTSLIKISGSMETSKSDAVFILDDDTLGTPHVAIRREEGGQFLIAAFGTVSFNDVISGNHSFSEREISKGNNPDKWVWKPLKDRSKIIMNNRTKVEFDVVRN